jgi:hypothetical protein
MGSMSAAALAVPAIKAQVATIRDANLVTTVLPANDDGSTSAQNIGFTIPSRHGPGAAGARGTMHAALPPAGILRRMIYKFKSPATGDLIMLGPHGDQLLRLLGREPAPQGIIEPAAMPAAIAALRLAIEQDEARRDDAASTEAPPGAGDDTDEEQPQRRVGLRQRLWPMVEMLRRAHAEDAPVVWGV